MSWNTCMQKKINEKWGPEAAANCCNDLNAEEWDKVAECLITYGVTDEAPILVTALGVMSAECKF